MSKKVPISTFTRELRSAWKRSDGYIMGSTGQNPKKWTKNSWWFTQYSGKQKTQALYWREHCARVWDCNGMSEGIYKDYTGVDINTKARYNYSQWCSPKGTGMIPAQYRIEGAAVFWGDAGKPGTIHHVAYLDAPVKAGHPEGDWYIIEARGVMYGVVRTKLYSRKPNFWGLMTKYFDYDNKTTVPVQIDTTTFGSRTLQKGMKGTDVQTLQNLLIQQGYKLPKYGADGDFGTETENALKAFQKENGLEVTGIADTAVFAKLKATVQTLVVTGLLVNVRAEANTSSKIVGVVKKGTALEATGETAANGWFKIKYKDKEAWISNKYSEMK